MLVDAAEISALSDALLEAGAFSVEVTDAAAGTERESPIFGEPGEDFAPAFNSNRVMALFAADMDVPAIVRSAAVEAGLCGIPTYEIREVADQDWVRLTQDQFHPIRVSARLWIVPSWHDIPDPTAIKCFTPGMGNLGCWPG